jgi:hypothetical protein
MIINKADVVVAGRINLPLDTYRVQITKTESGKSAAGNPMTTLAAEIVSPEVKTVNGDEYKIAGMPFRLFLVHTVALVGKQIESSQAEVLRFCTKLGLDIGDNYDTDLHKEYFLGQQFEMLLSSKEDVKRYPKNPGEKEGQPIKDSEGNTISNGFFINAQLRDVLDHCQPTRVDMANM